MFWMDRAAQKIEAALKNGREVTLTQFSTRGNRYQSQVLQIEQRSGSRGYTATTVDHETGTVKTVDLGEVQMRDLASFLRTMGYEHH